MAGVKKRRSMGTVIPRPEKFAETLSGIPLGVPVITLTLVKYRNQSRYPNGMNDGAGRDVEAIRKKSR